MDKQLITHRNTTSKFIVTSKWILHRLSWTLVISNYVYVLLTMSEESNDVTRYIIGKVLLGQYDPHKSRCLDNCFTITLQRSGKYCANICGSIWPHLLLHVASLGLLEFQWDYRIHWFMLRPSGLAYWTQFDAVHFLLDNNYIMKMLPGSVHFALPVFSLVFSRVLNDTIRAYVISCILIMLMSMCSRVILASFSMWKMIGRQFRSPSYLC